MPKKETNPKILEILIKKLKISKNAVQIRITRIKNKHYLSNNASAEIIARGKGFSISRYLSLEEKAELRDKEIVNKPTIKLNNKSKKRERIIEFIKYDTDTTSLKKHIAEVNRAYTFQCYTSAFILSRKIIENLVFKILKKKCERSEKNLYVVDHGGRIHDLKVLLENINNVICNRVDPDEKSLLKRITSKAKMFKDEANDKTHSLYHMANKKELDEANPQEILDLIEEEFKDFINA